MSGSDRTILAEDWHMIDKILPSDISRDSVIRAVATCNRYAWLCPVDRCDRIYGNKQRLDRHLSKEHSNDPGNGHFDKTESRYMEKLMKWLGMGMESQTSATHANANANAHTNARAHAQAHGNGNPLQTPVNMMNLGPSPRGSPGYDNQSPSSGDSAGLNLGLGAGTRYQPSSSGDLSSGVDGFGASYPDPTVHNQTTGQPSWTPPGTGLPFEETYRQSEPLGHVPSGWADNPARRGNAKPMSSSTGTPASYNNHSNFHFPSGQASSTSGSHGQQQYSHKYWN